MKKTDLLKKYFHDQCQPEEIVYLLRHLEPEDVENYEEVIKDLWDEFTNYPTLDSAVSERLYQNILEKGQITSASKEGNRTALKKHLYLFQKFAAVFIGLLLLTGISFSLFRNYAGTELTTAYGEKREIVLPDSSVITLNSNSSLKFNKSKFEENSREVWISGEAFFDIRKRTVGKERLKFIVHTDDITVEVLGTRFNVNSRREKTEVVLESGKVRLSVADNRNQEILMQPGDLVAYSSEDKKLEHKIVLPTEYSNWKNNQLVFNGVTLENIAHKIEDHFGYKVILVLNNPDLKSKQYRGTFPSDNLDVLLESLSKSFDLEVARENEKIILKEYSSETD